MDNTQVGEDLGPHRAAKHQGRHRTLNMDDSDKILMSMKII